MRNSVFIFTSFKVSKILFYSIILFIPLLLFSPSSINADTQGLQLIMQETGYLDFVALGVGTRGDPTTSAGVGEGQFTLNIPKNMIEVREARLIWTGRTEKKPQVTNIFDDDGIMLSLNGGTPINIMADTQVEQDPWFTSQSGNEVVQLFESADITNIIQDLIPNGGSYIGAIDVSTSDQEHGLQSLGKSPDFDLNYGAGIWIAYEYIGAANEPLSEVLMYEGQDSFFRKWTPPAGPHSDVQCVAFPASVDARVVEMVHLVSGVDLLADPNHKRSNAFWYSTGTGSPPTFNSPVPGIFAQPGSVGYIPSVDNYPLYSSSGLEWDNFETENFIQIPAGNEWACFQIESGDSMDLAGQGNAHYPASGMWNFFGIRMPSDVPPPPTAVSLTSFTVSHRGQLNAEVNWDTEEEIDNFGYNLYRNNSPDFATAELIHFEPTKVDNGSGSGAFYDYKDVAPHFGEWWYWLEDVDTGGQKTIHTPVTVDILQFIRYFLPIIIQE